MLQLLKRFVREEEGMETVEYALMLALFVLLAVAGAGTLATSISGAFTDTAADIDAATN